MSFAIDLMTVVFAIIFIGLVASAVLLLPFVAFGAIVGLAFTCVGGLLSGTSYLISKGAPIVKKVLFILIASLIVCLIFSIIR